MKREFHVFLALAGVFLAVYYLPVDQPRFQGAVIEALRLSRWYAREHVLLCLVPGFFIAGAIGVFVDQNSVMKYFGRKANRGLAYAVASVSGTILAVCSCTILPMFAGIRMRGAGLGPAIAFLYSGPAINVLAVVLTARVLGSRLGVARAIGAISFSIVIGILMHILFSKEERAKESQSRDIFIGETDKGCRPLWQTVLYFFAMVGILVFANWAKPQVSSGVWHGIFRAKWIITTGFAVLLAGSLWRSFGVGPQYILLAALPTGISALILPGYPTATFAVGTVGLIALTFGGSKELAEWRTQTWGFAKKILPLLLAGVLVSGFLLGSPENKNAGMAPNRWVEVLVGSSPVEFLKMIGRPEGAGGGWLDLVWPVWTNFFAAFAGALMYFATLTEVPILRGLIDGGMGQGPALALLLAGPALSLPSMLVINSILGPKKTLTYIGLVVGAATITGTIYGAILS